MGRSVTETIEFVKSKLDVSKLVASVDLKVAKALSRKGKHEQSKEYYSKWSSSLEKCKRFRKELEREVNQNESATP